MSRHISRFLILTGLLLVSISAYSQQRIPVYIISPPPSNVKISYVTQASQTTKNISGAVGGIIGQSIAASATAEVNRKYRETLSTLIATQSGETELLVKAIDNAFNGSGKLFDVILLNENHKESFKNGIFLYPDISYSYRTPGRRFEILRPKIRVKFELKGLGTTRSNKRMSAKWSEGEVALEPLLTNVEVINTHQQMAFKYAAQQAYLYLNRKSIFHKAAISLGYESKFANYESLISKNPFYLSKLGLDFLPEWKVRRSESLVKRKLYPKKHKKQISLSSHVLIQGLDYENDADDKNIVILQAIERLYPQLSSTLTVEKNFSVGDITVQASTTEGGRRYLYILHNSNDEHAVPILHVIDVMASGGDLFIQGYQNQITKYITSTTTGKRKS